MKSWRGLALTLVIALLGCPNPQPGLQQDPGLVQQIEKLEKDNQDLQELLRAQDAEYEKTTKALAEITRALAEISQEESTILQLRYSIEFGPENWQGHDLEEEALSRIRSVKSSLEQARQIRLRPQRDCEART